MLPDAGRLGLDLADWPIAFAPKPLLLLAGRYDFVDYNSIETTHAETSRIYQALGQAGRHELFTFDDGHGISKPKREAAVRFFLRWLKGDTSAAAVTEGVLPVATARELQCTATGQVSTSFAEEQSLSAFYQAEAQRLAAARPIPKPAALSELVRRQLGGATERLFRVNEPGSYPGPVSREDRDTLRRGGLLFQRRILRSGWGPPLPVLELTAGPAPRPAGRVLVCFADRGKAALADSTAWLRALLHQYQTVVLVDLRGQGETTDPAAALGPKYYNREYRPALLALHQGQPLLTQRVADIATVLSAYAVGRPRAGLDLYADGRTAALVALHAAMLTPRIGQVRLRTLPAAWAEIVVRPTAKNGYSDVLPGVLRRYDVPDLVRTLGRRVAVEKQ